MELIRKDISCIIWRQNSCFISGDVVFCEDVFPFRSSSAVEDPVMSLSSPMSSLDSSQLIPNSANHKVTTDSIIWQESIDCDDSPHFIPHDISEAESSVIRHDATDNVIPAPLRKSNRKHKGTTRLQDYVSRPPGEHACVYPISHDLGYSSLSPKYQTYS